MVPGLPLYSKLYYITKLGMYGCQGGTPTGHAWMDVRVEHRSEEECFYWLLPVLYRQLGLSWTKLVCWWPPQLETGISGSLGLYSHPLRQLHSNLKVGEKADMKQKSDYWLIHHLLDNLKHKTLARVHGYCRAHVCSPRQILRSCCEGVLLYFAISPWTNSGRCCNTEFSSPVC